MVCIYESIFEKQLGIITALTNGEKEHKELQLIMETLMANFTADTMLLIPHIKEKLDDKEHLTDSKTNSMLFNFVHAYQKLIS